MTILATGMEMFGAKNAIYLYLSGALETTVNIFSEGAAEADVWKLNAKITGTTVESQLSKTEYKDWYNIGQENNGKFPVIDFQKGNNVVSLKTIDPTLKSYAGNGATNKIIDYLNDLNVGIRVNGKLANKVLDVRIPPGTKGLLDVNILMKEARDMGIKLIIKEFK